MVNLREIKWDKCKEIVTLDRIKYIESIIGKVLPLSYIETVSPCDQGAPLRTDFQYYDIYFEDWFYSGIGSFLALNESKSLNFLKLYYNPPEFFPKGVIAFAENGGGDFMCFDYRVDEESRDPQIILWRHGTDLEKSISFIANNFEEFLNMLEEPNDSEF